MFNIRSRMSDRSSTLVEGENDGVGPRDTSHVGSPGVHRYKDPYPERTCIRPIRTERR